LADRLNAHAHVCAVVTVVVGDLGPQFAAHAQQVDAGFPDCRRLPLCSVALGLSAVLERKRDRGNGGARNARCRGDHRDIDGHVSHTRIFLITNCGYTPALGVSSQSSVPGAAIGCLWLAGFC
jgi:hypothetical protein